MKQMMQYGNQYVAIGQTEETGMQKVMKVVYSPPARLAGSAAAGFHGYKRNKSIGWALLWGFFGGASPVFTNVIAAAQGFGKKKKK